MQRQIQNVSISSQMSEFYKLIKSLKVEVASQNLIKKLENLPINPKSIIIHVPKFANESLQSIKLNYIADKSSLPKIIIALSENETTKKYYLNDSIIIKIIETLKQLALNLGLAEFAVKKSLANKQQIYATNMWGDYAWDDQKTHGLWYDKVSDPMILNTFKSYVLFTAKNNDDSLVVLDIGGGKGRLAEKLISEILENDIKIHYILIEPTKQIEVAKEILRKFIDNENCKISFIQSKFLDADIKDQANCIISNGGPININIVDRKTALEHVNKIESYLLPDGFFIATGQTALLVKAKDFSKAGLRVLSYATPCITPPGYENNDFIKKSCIVGGFFGNYQRYICIKTKNVEKKIELCDEQGNKPENLIITRQYLSNIK